MAAVATGGRLIMLLFGASSDPVLPEVHGHPESGRPQLEAGGAPSREMLLYLAEFEDAEGEFVDPLEVDPDAVRTEPARPPQEPRGGRR